MVIEMSPLIESTSVSVSVVDPVSLSTRYRSPPAWAAILANTRSIAPSAALEPIEVVAVRSAPMALISVLPAVSSSSTIPPAAFRITLLSAVIKPFCVLPLSPKIMSPPALVAISTLNALVAVSPAVTLRTRASPATSMSIAPEALVTLVSVMPPEASSIVIVPAAVVVAVIDARSVSTEIAPPACSTASSPDRFTDVVLPSVIAPPTVRAIVLVEAALFTRPSDRSFVSLMRISPVPVLFAASVVMVVSMASVPESPIPVAAVRSAPMALISVLPRVKSSSTIPPAAFRVTLLSAMISPSALLPVSPKTMSPALVVVIDTSKLLPPALSPDSTLRMRAVPTTSISTRP